MKTANFNPDQLCTIEQAREYVARVNKKGIGLGVAPEVIGDDWHNDVSGIYLPPWDNSTGDNPEPQIGDARGYLMRFNHQPKTANNPDGFQPAGFNIGLGRATARNHVVEGTPEAEWAWEYALGQLETEVDAAIAAADPKDS